MPAPYAICIRCLAHGQVSMSLNDEREFRCEACKKTFTAIDVKELLTSLHAAWDDRLKWVEGFPVEKK